jgi:ubiquinone/menaquinone biosynthesis C-methylase UbiE
MEWYEFYDIAERYIELINPLSREKVIEAGRHLRLSDGMRIIDFGCGYAEPMVMWAETYGITGIGIEFRPRAVERARKKIAERGLDGKIEIIHKRGAEFDFNKESFDAAVCMGASFIWKGFDPTVEVLKTAIKPTGRILIGEPYWKTDRIPAEYEGRKEIYSELQLMEIVHKHKLDIEYIIRSSEDDWAQYEAANWKGLIAWLEENPDHEDRQAVIDWLRKTQDEYFRFGREHLGWALYFLNPVLY